LLGFDVHSHAFILAPWRACVSLAGSVRFFYTLLGAARGNGSGSVSIDPEHPKVARDRICSAQLGPPSPPPPLADRGDAGKSAV